MEVHHMGNISFGGLSSGLDTQSIIEQLLRIESRPLNLVTQQRERLQKQSEAYKDLNTRLIALESAAFELTQLGSLVNRKATSSQTDKLLATANANAIAGTYEVTILQRATASRLQTGSGAGQGNTLGGIADNTNFSADTITAINSANRLGVSVTQGTFFVNGQSVSVLNSDTLAEVFNKIDIATGGAVTAQLVSDPAKGGLVLELQSGSAISVSNGTSNFLSAFKLNTASYSAGTLVSSDAVNAVRSGLKLDGSNGSANLAQIVGSGTLTVNGKAISYDDTQDSLDDIVKRINAANAGVRANFSNLGGGRLNLVNDNYGPLAISVVDTGNLADALGLNGSNSNTVGQSAQIQVDGGPTQSFNQNTGISAEGLNGVILDLLGSDPVNPVTVSIAADTDLAISKVEKFIEQFNALTKKIDELRSFNVETKEKGLFLADFTVSSLRNRLQQTLFETVSGLNGGSPLGSMTELGLSTGALGSSPGTTTELQLDASKFRAALEANPTRVAQLFGAEETATGSQGIMTRMKDYLNGLSNSTGVFNSKQRSNERQIASLTQRINLMNQRLDKRQQQLESQFLAMERAISRMQAQQQSLNSLFASINYQQRR